MWRVIRPDAHSVWDHPDVKKILSRYKDILENRETARYLIFKKIPANIEIKNEPIDLLWNKHDLIGENINDKRFFEEIKDNDVHIGGNSYLDLKIELLKRIMTSCHLCERKCHVNRLRGEKGYCKIGEFGNIYSVHLHYGEEAPLVPSGTIFFTGCTFSCCFCQNYDISTKPQDGEQINPQKLSALANTLARDERAKNINYVSPLAHTYGIVYSMKMQKMNVAQLWNSNHYCSLDTMKIISDLFDIWLPDFKYGNDECAFKYSNAPNYWSLMTRNHKIIYDASGEIIIRHLVMPGHVECCSKPILEWISKNIPYVLVNIMGQYRPAHLVLRKKPEYDEINRRPTSQEMKAVTNYASDLGILWQAVS